MANYSNLKAAIAAAIKTNGNQEITGQILQDVLTSIVSVIGANYTFAGVATPSTNPGTPDQNVVYMASQAGTYTNFGGIELPAGISLLMWNGTWTSETVMYGDGGVFDISVYKSSGGTLATYADLSAALDGGNNIPASARKGGMSVKYVQSSDNKYVQARCMAQNFTTDVTQWQGVDDEPIAGSNNLVKSGGVYEEIRKRVLNEIPLIKTHINNYCEPGGGTLVPLNGYSATDYIDIRNSLDIVVYNVDTLYGAFYGEGKNFLKGITINGLWNGIIGIPEDAYFIRISTKTESYDVAKIYLNTDKLSLSKEIQVSVWSLNDIFKEKAIKSYFYSYIDKRYIAPDSGTEAFNNAFSATNYINIEGISSLCFYNVNEVYGAFYNENKEYIKGIVLNIVADKTIVEVPDGAIYMRFSSSTTMVMKTYFTTKLVLKDIYIEEDNVLTHNKSIITSTITVKPNGGGNYTKISDAIASITDSNFYKRYIIKFYGDGSEYDTLIDKPFVDGQIGLTLPPFTKLIGVGGKEKCILVRRLSEVNDADSLLNLHATSELEGFTLISDKTRYTVHDDFFRNDELDLLDFERKIKDCDIIASNTYYYSAWGSGTRSGVKWSFENCRFINRTASKKDFTSHNNTNFVNPSIIKFINCRFDSDLGSGFGSLTTNALNINNYVESYGCRFKKIELYEENPVEYGTGILWKVSGFANNLRTGDDDITIHNTDGVDYSDNIDMI